MTAKKGKTSAKKTATKKKTVAKKAAPKKPAAKPVVKAATESSVKATPAPEVVSKITPAQAAAAKKVKFTPRKGDIVIAYGKHYRVETASKTRKNLFGTHLNFIECRMTGSNQRLISFDHVTALYRGVK